MLFVGAGQTAFDTPEVGETMGVGTFRQPHHLGPLLIVHGVAANVDYPIDAT
jgi:hypothetical protein